MVASMLEIYNEEYRDLLAKKKGKDEVQQKKHQAGWGGCTQQQAGRGRGKPAYRPIHPCHRALPFPCL